MTEYIDMALTVVVYKVRLKKISFSKQGENSKKIG